MRDRDPLTVRDALMLVERLPDTDTDEEPVRVRDVDSVQLLLPDGVPDRDIEDDFDRLSEELRDRVWDGDPDTLDETLGVTLAEVLSEFELDSDPLRLTLML